MALCYFGSLMAVKKLVIRVISLPKRQFAFGRHVSHYFSSHSNCLSPLELCQYILAKGGYLQVRPFPYSAAAKQFTLRSPAE